MLGFVRVEERGSGGAQYYYLCSYDPRSRNVHKEYLGPVHSVEAQRKVNFFMWLNSLDEEKIRKLKDESVAAQRSGPSFHTSLERVLELGRLAGQS
jgi:hypothetical protein